MKIDSLKELKELIQLCRKLGVDAIEVDNVKFGLTTLVVEPRKAKRKQAVMNQLTSDGTQDVPDMIDMPDELTQEQLLMWSTGEAQ